MYKDKLDRLNRSRVDHLPSQGGLRIMFLITFRQSSIGQLIHIEAVRIIEISDDEMEGKANDWLT